MAKETKEPWEMTSEKYLEIRPTQTTVDAKFLKRAGRKKVVYLSKFNKNAIFKEPEDVVLFEHQEYIKQAVQQGKPVPCAVLEEYKSEKWAQEAMAQEAMAKNSSLTS